MPLDASARHRLLPAIDTPPSSQQSHTPSAMMLPLRADMAVCLVYLLAMLLLYGLAIATSAAACHIILLFCATPFSRLILRHACLLYGADDTFASRVTPSDTDILRHFLRCCRSSLMILMPDICHACQRASRYITRH